MVDTVLLVSAAFLAGGINTIAGGGSFLTFPALVFVGVPPISANATSAVVVLPGYLGGALGFRNELRELETRRLIQFVGLALVGGLAGSLLLLVTSSETFKAMVPWLLLMATFIFAIGERVRAWAEARENFPKIPELTSLLAVSVYGGYFNGGLGIMLLALFSLNGKLNLNAMNGLKNALSFPLSLISVVTFAVAGIVEWSLAVPMMIAATIGGYAGTYLARALPKTIVRGMIIAIGLTMSAAFFWKG